MDLNFVCIDVIPRLKQDTFWGSFMFISCYNYSKEKEMIGYDCLKGKFTYCVVKKKTAFI